MEFELDNDYEITLALIKPDAVEAKLTGKIIDMIENHGFEILRIQKGVIDEEMAKQFYAEHKDKPFFKELVTFITSGPIMAMALGKNNAIVQWRELMGATNPANAAEGTIRKKFGTSIDKNVVHGSDSTDAALRELGLFFGAESEEEDDDYECDDAE